MTMGKDHPSFFGGHGEMEVHSIVYGLRNWKIDSHGRLTGVVHRQVWVPGVNEARCFKNAPATYGTYGGSMPTLPPEGAPIDHDLDKCSCGFYAYYDGSRDYHTPGDVTGVVKGTGLGVIGLKGFRVTRAQIMGLTFSGSITEPVRNRIARVYPDVQVFPSVHRLLKAFPLTAGDLEYVPEADDDFWTKPA